MNLNMNTFKCVHIHKYVNILMVTGTFPPMKSMHGNNVVWLCAKYAVDANLFRLESSILMRATNRDNVWGGEFTKDHFNIFFGIKEAVW